MPTTGPINPLSVAKFRVEIDGIAASGFLSVTGIDADTNVVDYREGGDQTPGRKLSGAVKFSNIVLKRGLTADLSLWNWMKDTLSGNVSRRNMSVVILDDAGTEVLRLNFSQARPVKWIGPTLNAEGNGVAIETLEIAHEQLSVEG